MQQPNILIFMTDQQRGDSILPEHPARTPHLDRFLQEGVVFTDARCPSPHCCPSRATFFTGLYPTEHGIWHNVSVQNAISRDLHPGVRLWSEDLAARGYDLRYNGKWHVSYERAPRDFGWHEGRVTAGPAKDGAGWMGNDWGAYGAMAADGSSAERAAAQVLRPGWGTYTHYGVRENPFGDEDVLADGLAALDEQLAGDRPWCSYIGTLGPHDPYVVPQRFLDLYRDVGIPLPASFDDDMDDKPGLYRRTRDAFAQLPPEEHREAIRHYWAFCSYEDWLFGQALERLDASGQAENTIVIYCSDHGDYCGEHRLWCKGLPCFTSAYHVPLAVRWPAGVVAPGRRVDAKVGLEDIARTLLDCTGDEAEAWPGSGRSLLPWLRGETPDDWRTAHCTQTNGNELYGIQRSIDDGHWKYVYNGFDLDELYDLQADPEQTTNLARRPEQAERIQSLCARMWSFAAEHQETCVNSYIMVGLAPCGPASAFGPDGRLQPSGA